ncbi:hypothetical protein Patl1_34067 [Pistacia atlantica]|uniref:Uncharacterized protein n=1 Tax=Pistacia atlantica TaxID=434234 RepID=A0ACC0ZTH0_9ROSI|nr:hypothetical protein Patl1_34067 [Pistacia atlantica]
MYFCDPSTILVNPQNQSGYLQVLSATSTVQFISVTPGERVKNILCYLCAPLMWQHVEQLNRPHLLKIPLTRLLHHEPHHIKKPFLCKLRKCTFVIMVKLNSCPQISLLEQHYDIGFPLTTSFMQRSLKLLVHNCNHFIM